MECALGGIGEEEQGYGNFGRMAYQRMTRFISVAHVAILGE